MKESHLRKKKYPTGFETWTDRVSGVTFENEDGSDRQSILDDVYTYNDGDFEYWVPDLERYSYEGKPAYRVVSEYGVIGNLAQETADQLAVLDDAGYIITVQGGAVYGGPTDDYPDRNYGCRIELGLSSPEFQKKMFDNYMKEQKEAEEKKESPSKAAIKKALSEMEKQQTVHSEAKASKVEQGVPRIVADDNISDKKKSSALILCFFLGVFGAHRFYVGKMISGVLMGVYGLIWAFLVYAEGSVIFTDSVNIVSALMPILWVIDIVRIAANRFLDYRGRKLS